jgi:hypothetical protein
VITVLIVILVVLAAAGGAGLAVLKQRRQGDGGPAYAADAPPDVESLPPMSGLEAALDQVAGRSGETLRDRLEAESAVVDDLRVPDDTGPLLRRALDRVANPNEAGQPDVAGDDAGAAAPGDVPPPPATGEAPG